MDRMPLYEIETLIDNKWRKDKSSWEQTRMQAYFTAQCQSTKKVDIKEILPFPWDNVKIEEHEDTQEEKDAIIREMKVWENKMNKENNNQIDGQ